ncbi:hypothetical protein BDR26DRAFT_861503 [Obelidium mucronatum]|nr:hypothetical protein BDR26DRAFT_861503 [Obelidium mucronatum]
MIDPIKLLITTALLLQAIAFTLSFHVHIKHYLFQLPISSDADPSLVAEQQATAAAVPPPSKFQEIVQQIDFKALGTMLIVISWGLLIFALQRIMREDGVDWKMLRRWVVRSSRGKRKETGWLRLYLWWKLSEGGKKGLENDEKKMEVGYSIV